MPRKEDFDLQKVTLNLFRGDWEKLQVWHPELGASKVIREIIHAYVRANEERFNQQSSGVQLKVNIEEIPLK